MLRLESERLIIRIPNTDDIDAIVDYFERNKAHLSPYEPAKRAEFYTKPFWIELLGRYHAVYQQGWEYRFFIFEKAAPERVIGTLSFTNISSMPLSSCNIGYGIDEHKQGQGFMFEAASRGIGYIFEGLNLHRIQAGYLPHNIGSGKLLRKLGFQVEGYCRDYLFINDKWQDHIIAGKINPAHSGD